MRQVFYFTAFAGVGELGETEAFHGPTQRAADMAATEWAVDREDLLEKDLLSRGVITHFPGSLGVTWENVGVDEAIVTMGNLMDLHGTPVVRFSQVIDIAPPTKQKNKALT
tara:strand:- start:8088 stop:8420 length:333 start_codon:yes stop_codon:yes gene_type:complete